MASAPTKVIVAVGTYDGVLAGWEWKNDERSKFEISFATPVHDGSVRSLSIAQNVQLDQPGALLSCGYDEVLRTHNFSKRMTSSGEIRTPSDLGTPVCAAFAPPLVLVRDADAEKSPHTTHCLAGFASGQLVIYKKRDWSVQHILKGHEGGVSSMAVHPTGSMALTGGLADGRLKLWDLTKGRLAYNHKIQPSRTTSEGKTFYDAINCIVWTDEAYAFCYGAHVTVKDVATGTDLLDVELPSKVNQVCFLQGPEGLFVVSANNDGSLAVLHVDKSGGEERRAIMAIEPVEGPVAGEERFKCLQQVANYHVVTANSAGVVSLMDLSGAVRMIMQDTDDESKSDEEDEKDSKSEDDGSDSENDEEEELAVDIIDSIQLGTGNRVTCLAAWSTMAPVQVDEEIEDEDEKKTFYPSKEEGTQASHTQNEKDEEMDKKRKRDDVQELNASALERARDLVASAKKIREKRQKKSKKKTKAKI
eukprot:scaffold2363_cov159-Amphora_coffeaeformis.AAC.3